LGGFVLVDGKLLVGLLVGSLVGLVIGLVVGRSIGRLFVWFVD